MMQKTRHDQQILDRQPEHVPHGPDGPVLDGEEGGEMIAHDHPHRSPEDHYLDDVLEKLDEVLEGEDFLEPFGRADVFQLGHGPLEGEEHAYLPQIGDERHGHDQPHRRGD